MCTGTGDVRDLISSWGGEMTQYHMQQGNSQDMWLFALLAVSAIATSNASVNVKVRNNSVELFLIGITG